MDRRVLLLIFTTERLLLPGEQVETAPARRHVAPVPELAAVPGLAAAGETLPAFELLVGLAGEGGELALGRDGVGEQLVGSPVVAEVTVGLALILGCVG